jgi:hypothetical protein
MQINIPVAINLVMRPIGSGQLGLGTLGTVRTWGTVRIVGTVRPVRTVGIVGTARTVGIMGIVGIALTGFAQSAISAPAVSPDFTPVAMPPHSYTGGWEHFVGGGLAVFDCNDDQMPEMYAAGGSSPSTLMRNESIRGQAIKFSADTPASLALTGVTGAYPLDIDSDAILDLFVMRVGENMMLKGHGDCQFSEFDDLNVATGDRWTTAFSATWERDQYLPTLAVGHYVDRSNPDGPFKACDVNHLIRPVNGAPQDGSHTNSYSAAQVLAPGFCPLSMLFSDWSGMGSADLRISNDRHYYVKGGAEQMWSMSATPRLYSEADGWVTHQLWGMGIAARDVTGNGIQEIFLTSMADQRLQEKIPNTDGPAYRDVPYSWGTTAHRPYTGGDGRPSTGWHVAFGDAQNDGLDDVFIAKGNVQQMPGSAMDDPNNLLIQQSDGRFVEMGLSAGIASMHRGRGAVFADLNSDGLPDLAVVNRVAPLEVWQNVTHQNGQETGDWLAVSLRQPAPNTRAIGAFIEVKTPNRTMSHEVTVGAGHAGGSALPEHFGLGKLDAASDDNRGGISGGTIDDTGDAVNVSLRVRWPHKGWSNWVDLLPNQHVTVSPDGLGLVISTR